MALSIVEIKQALKEIESEADPLFQEWQRDTRKGVQQAISQWYKIRERDALLEMRFKEMSAYESNLRSIGITEIAGVDEVGRGPLAGPVVAAAVILPDGVYLGGIDDSKRLSETKRESFYQVIMEKADVGIGIISAQEIDKINIYEATKKAMISAVGKLKQAPQHLLIDAMSLSLPIDQTSIIKGDAKSISIAAASIVAKITRDNLMKGYAEDYPHFLFEKNMGYGTKDHLLGLKEYGPCAIHRKSFAPVKLLL